jgi:hypothetical protein
MVYPISPGLWQAKQYETKSNGSGNKATKTQRKQEMSEAAAGVTQRATVYSKLFNRENTLKQWLKVQYSGYLN